MKIITTLLALLTITGCSCVDRNNASKNYTLANINTKAGQHLLLDDPRGREIESSDDVVYLLKALYPEVLNDVIYDGNGRFCGTVVGVIDGEKIIVNFPRGFAIEDLYESEAIIYRDDIFKGKCAVSGICPQGIIYKVNYLESPIEVGDSCVNRM